RRLDLLDGEHGAGVEFDLRFVDEQDRAAAGGERPNTVADEQRLQQPRRVPLLLVVRQSAVDVPLNQHDLALSIAGRGGRLALGRRQYRRRGREDTEGDSARGGEPTSEHVNLLSSGSF